MLKSLFSGVSGLQSHQVAMDVESNNIANVNTIGYKYSRVNFSDLLAQTRAIATAPQGELGGKNPVQVGLGVSASSTTRIFSQGSIQNSDKNTDVAIQGDGFFIVSPDGGSTYKYTRSGDFKFDAYGNFVDNNGFIVQGWLRNPDTGEVDATAPIVNINIPPGLTTPARATEKVVVKANLNSGPNIDQYSAAYRVGSTPVGGIAPGAIDKNGNPIASDNMGVMFNEKGEALSLQAGQGVWIGFSESRMTGAAPVAVPAVDTTETIVLTMDDSSSVSISYTLLAANTSEQNAQVIKNAINAKGAVTGVMAETDGAGTLTLVNNNLSPSSSHNIRIQTGSANAGLAVGDTVTAYKYTYDPAGATTTVGTNKRFTTIADLREAMELQARADGGPDNAIEIEINAQGKFEIRNPNGTNPADDYTVNIAVTAVVESGVTENTRFTRAMEALNSTLPAGGQGKALSQSFNAASHFASIDIYDSLGSKHTLAIEFRKVSNDPITGSEWAMYISVPEPGAIDTTVPVNEKRGTIRFNNDGSLATFTPPNISYTANNGSAPNQQVSLMLGTANAFDGMTSFDSASATSGISQDGFTGGDLVGIRIDQSGTLMGSFSNGRSFGLAQIAMAKFANNEGLTSEGSNVYVQTANSGDPIIGTAATAGRGFMQAAALEASNVDLSLALTQLIIIQRGYQANGKTITTSDTLLETLIGLKR